MINVLITVEGVLSKEYNLRSSLVSHLGKPFYDGLASQYRCLGMANSTIEIARWWMRREAMDQWAQIRTPLIEFNYDRQGIQLYREWRIEQIKDFLSDGTAIEFLVDHDPLVCEVARQLGVHTLHLGMPTRPVGWKDTTSAESQKPWADVVGTLYPSMVPAE